MINGDYNLIGDPLEAPEQQEMNCDPEELLNKINKLLNKKNNK